MTSLENNEAKSNKKIRRGNIIRKRLENFKILYVNSRGMSKIKNQKLGGDH